MKSIITLILLLVSITGYSQRIGINTIIKIHNQNPIDAEKYLFSLGFDVENEYGDIGNYDTYSYNKYANTKTNYLNVCKYIFKDFSIKTSFTTLLKNEYTVLKEDVEKKGFKYISSSKNNQTVKHTYEKGNYRIQMSIYTPESNKIMYYIEYIDIEHLFFYSIHNK